MEPIVKHGKHRGRRLSEVIRDDPNYAIYAHSKYAWFPNLGPEQVKDCWSRYKRLWPISHRTGLEMRDWSTYDMADYGDGWC